MRVCILTSAGQGKNFPAENLRAHIVMPLDPSLLVNCANKNVPFAERSSFEFNQINLIEFIHRTNANLEIITRLPNPSEIFSSDLQELRNRFLTRSNHRKSSNPRKNHTPLKVAMATDIDYDLLTIMYFLLDQLDLHVHQSNLKHRSTLDSKIERWHLQNLTLINFLNFQATAMKNWKYSLLSEFNHTTNGPWPCHIDQLFYFSSYRY